MTIEDGALQAALASGQGHANDTMKNAPSMDVEMQSQAPENSPAQSTSAWKCFLLLLPELAWSVGYYVAFTAVCQLAVNCQPWLALLPLSLWAWLRERLAVQPWERPAVWKLLGVSVLIGLPLNTILAIQPLWPIVVNDCAMMPFGPDPPWMLTFWLGYASMVWWLRPIFTGKWVVCAILGAIFGPSSYIAGRAMGALIFPPEAAILIAIEHGCSFPLLTYLATKFRTAQEVERDLLASREDAKAESS